MTDATSTDAPSTEEPSSPAPLESSSPTVFAPDPPPPPPVPSQGPAGELLEITCPGCGTVSHFAELRKSAEEFCRRCDYPLFWVRRSLGGDSGPDGDGDTGLRRLPGAGGWRSEASMACPACREPNRIDAGICVRCGADLRPAPMPRPAPAPAPVAPVVVEPEPEPTPPRWPLWLLAVVVAVTVLLVVWALTR